MVSVVAGLAKFNFEFRARFFSMVPCNFQHCELVAGLLLCHAQPKHKAGDHDRIGSSKHGRERKQGTAIVVWGCGVGVAVVQKKRKLLFFFVCLGGGRGQR